MWDEVAGPYRAAVEATDTAVLAAGGDGRLVVANAAAARLLGYRLDELLGLRWADVAPEGPARPTEAWRLRRQDGSAVAAHTLIRRLDVGGRPLDQIVLRPVPGS